HAGRAEPVPNPTAASGDHRVAVPSGHRALPRPRRRLGHGYRPCPGIRCESFPRSCGRDILVSCGTSFGGSMRGVRSIVLVVPACSSKPAQPEPFSTRGHVSGALDLASLAPRARTRAGFLATPSGFYARTKHGVILATPSGALTMRIQDRQSVGFETLD